MSAVAMDPKCKCGCGEPCNTPSGYLRGHWSRTAEGRAHMRRAGVRGAATVNQRKVRRTLSALSPTEQAIQPEVSEGWSDDDVVTMLRTIGVADAKIERMIELMDFIGKIKRGEE